MNFTSLFVLAGIPFFNPVWRIFKRKPLNVFDIMLLFAFLYFWAIPVQDFLYNHVRPEYIGHTNTALAVCIYMWATLAASSLVRVFRVSSLLVTNIMERISIIQVKDWFQLFAFFYIAYVFTGITDYSGVDAEANNNFQYGLNVGFVQRVLALCYQPFFPAMVLMLYRNRPKGWFYRWLRVANLAFVLVTLLLGAKMFMFFNLALFLTYFYSINRRRLGMKHIGMAVGCLTLFFVVIFPLSQSFRLYKQMMFETADHSFQTVLTGYVSGGMTEDIAEQTEDYQETRSLNVYDATDWAASRTEYRGEGYLTGIILRYIIPQRMRKDGNIMGDMMKGKGADIGESVLAWYILDWGVVAGPIAAVLHSFLFFIAVFKFGLFFNRFFRSSVYPLVILSVLMNYAVTIEHNPATDIKMFYNTYYLVILFTGMVLALCKQKRIVHVATKN